MSYGCSGGSCNPISVGQANREYGGAEKSDYKNNPLNYAGSGFSNPYKSGGMVYHCPNCGHIDNDPMKNVYVSLSSLSGYNSQLNPSAANYFSKKGTSGIEQKTKYTTADDIIARYDHNSSSYPLAW